MFHCWLQVKQSQKFGKILELILLMGNILNDGSRHEQSVGFHISYLPKLSNTKDKDNKHTLLHFLVIEIKKNHPSILDFQDELSNIETASKISKASVQKSLKEMENYLSFVDTELNYFQQSEIHSEDLYGETMGVFAKEAKEEYHTLKVPFLYDNFIF